MPEPLAARAAAFYTGILGWALVDIPPGSKGPRMPRWQRRAIQDSREARRWWVRHPTHGMGLLHSVSGTATLDADAPGALVALALAAAGVDYPKLLAAPGPRLEGNPAHPAKLLYRVPSDLKLCRRALAWPSAADLSRAEVVIELRAGGVQDVLPPSVHPGTGHPYRWTGSGCPRRREDVPELPPELLALWLDWPRHLSVLRLACPWAPPLPPTPPAELRPRRPDEPSTIRLFRELVPVGRILERNGYRPSHGRWIAPGSTSGVAGVVLLDDGRVYSHHASDALADGHAHDSMSALALLEHGGDLRAAVRSARLELGLRIGRPP